MISPETKLLLARLSAVALGGIICWVFWEARRSLEKRRRDKERAHPDEIGVC